MKNKIRSYADREKSTRIRTFEIIIIWCIADERLNSINVLLWIIYVLYADIVYRMRTSVWRMSDFILWMRWVRDENLYRSIHSKLLSQTPVAIRIYYYTFGLFRTASPHVRTRLRSNYGPLAPFFSPVNTNFKIFKK